MTKYVYTYLHLEIGEMGEMDEIVEMVEIGHHFAHFARATSLIFLDMIFMLFHIGIKVYLCLDPFGPKHKRPRCQCLLGLGQGHKLNR